jgi:hypothetical protein
MRGRRLRRLAALLLTCTFCFWITGTGPADAQVRIRNDQGGLISRHMEQFTHIRNSGQSVIIDGPCYSACTLVLGMIPHERLCVTPRAQLGFHAAWAYAPNGSVVPSRSGTDSIWNVYPPQIRRWISSKGGLSPKLIVLQGRELNSMYRRCS